MPEQYSRERFDALVLYIAHRAQRYKDFGRTKLAKVLFYSDFDAYRDMGTSLTGATYIRMPFGPFPRQLEEAEERLEQSGRVRLAYGVDQYEEKRILPVGQQPALEPLFELWQVRLVDLWLNEISSASARQISELSHEHLGWLLAGEIGSEIEYGTAFLPQEPPTAIEAQEAKRLARERGWLSERGWLWQREAL